MLNGCKDMLFMGMRDSVGYYSADLRLLSRLVRERARGRRGARVVGRAT